MSCICSGTLHHIDFTTGPSRNPAPRNLSQTGCVVANNPQQPATGLIPVRDQRAVLVGRRDQGALARAAGRPGRHGAHRRRLGLPESHGADEELPRRHAADRDAPADAPPGRQLGRLHATSGTRSRRDATLVEGGAVRDIGNGQNWIFPSETQCLRLPHERSEPRARPGNGAAQSHLRLHADRAHRERARDAEPHRRAVAGDHGFGGAAGHARSGGYDRIARRIARAPTCTPTARSAIARADRRRARWTCATRRRSTRRTRATSSPQAGDLGIGANARLIAPGSAANSIVVNRANRRDSNGMPPLGSNQVDTAGVTLLTQWINSLTGC